MARGGRIHLTPSRAFSQRFVYDPAGLRLQAAAPDFAPAVVARVLAASPALEAGFQPGDVIIEVDGRPVGTSTLEHLREMFRQPGKRFTIRVRREGNIVALMMNTKELL